MVWLSEGLLFFARRPYVNFVNQFIRPTAANAHKGASYYFSLAMYVAVMSMANTDALAVIKIWVAGHVDEHLQNTKLE